MAALVPIPWQPHLFLTPDTLALLVAAGVKRGKPLHIVGNDGAWRSYDLQAAYYENYLHHGGNLASDPNVGQRSHMRGGAFDLINTDAATQAACRAVGLVRDKKEAWHWNNPRWASMPIIKTNTATSSGTITQIEDEEDMPTAAEIAEAVWRFELTNTNGVKARATDILFASANEGESIARQKVLTDSLDYILNSAPDSLKAVHADVKGKPTTTAGGAAIDYDLLATKVADKLAARLVS